MVAGTEIRDFEGFARCVLDDSASQDAVGTSRITLYRGQISEFDLVPGIGRDNCPIETDRCESDFYKSFFLMGDALMKNITPSHEFIDKLIVAQHFGLKTRLLDWTENPLIALWFACSAKEKKEVAVYRMDAYIKPRPHQHLTENLRLHKETFAFQSPWNNNRITAQRGWFTAHHRDDSGKIVPLCLNNNITSIHAFKIRNELKDNFLHKLSKLGIDEFKVFGDLDALSSQLNKNLG